MGNVLIDVSFTQNYRNIDEKQIRLRYACLYPFAHFHRQDAKTQRNRAPFASWRLCGEKEAKKFARPLRLSVFAVKKRHQV